MDAGLYIQVLEHTLLPFLEDVCPDSHRFMADKDPKHIFRAARAYLEHKQVNWWRTPAESPDLNPIENMWHELFIRREVKPKIKQELIDAIRQFWATVDVASQPRLSGRKAWYPLFAHARNFTRIL